MRSMKIYGHSPLPQLMRTSALSPLHSHDLEAQYKKKPHPGTPSQFVLIMHSVDVSTVLRMAELADVFSSGISYTDALFIQRSMSRFRLGS